MSNNNNAQAQQPRGPRKPKNLSSPNKTPLGRPRDHSQSGRETQRASHSGVFQGHLDDDRNELHVGTNRHNDEHTTPTQASSAHTTSEENDQPLPMDAGVPRTDSTPPSPPQQPPSSPYALSPPRTPPPPPTPSEQYRAQRAQEARERNERAELRKRQAEEWREARARETPEEREKRERKEKEHQKNRNMGDGAAAGFIDVKAWDNTA